MSRQAQQAWIACIELVLSTYDSMTDTEYVEALQLIKDRVREQIETMSPTRKSRGPMRNAADTYARLKGAADAGDANAIRAIEAARQLSKGQSLHNELNAIARGFYDKCRDSRDTNVDDLASFIRANLIDDDEPERAQAGTGQACGAANDCTRLRGHTGPHYAHGSKRTWG